MKIRILVFAAAVLLNGCGIFNSASKQKLNETTLEKSSSSHKLDVNTAITDNSIITVTEKLDTTIRTPEVKGQGKKKVDLNGIKDGLNVLDDQFVNIFQIYDSVDSSLKTTYNIKPRVVKVPKERKTDIYKYIITNKQEKNDSKQEAKKKGKSSGVTVDRKAGYSVIYVILGVICVALLIIRINKT